MNSANTDKKYYFVSLGRKPGGYLDLLGLPPDATEEQAAEKENAYRIDLQNYVKKRRKPLRESLGAGEITQEEYDAQIKAWEQEATDLGSELNDKKAEYTARQATRRKLARLGIVYDDTAWMGTFNDFRQDQDGFWRRALAPRPLARVDAGDVDRLDMLLLDLETGQVNSWPVPATLVEVGRMVRERDQLRLHTADYFWEQVQYTNRAVWRAHVEQWAAEIIELGSPLCPPATLDGAASKTQYLAAVSSGLVTPAQRKEFEECLADVHAHVKLEQFKQARDMLTKFERGRPKFANSIKGVREYIDKVERELQKQQERLAHLPPMAAAALKSGDFSLTRDILQALDPASAHYTEAKAVLEELTEAIENSFEQAFAAAPAPKFAALAAPYPLALERIERETMEDDARIPRRPSAPSQAFSFAELLEHLAQMGGENAPPAPGPRGETRAPAGETASGDRGMPSFEEVLARLLESARAASEDTNPGGSSPAPRPGGRSPFGESRPSPRPGANRPSSPGTRRR